LVPLDAIASTGSATGTVTTIIGAPALSGNPLSIAQAPYDVVWSGTHLLVADAANGVVRSYDPWNGSETTIAGVGGEAIYPPGDHSSPVGGPALKAQFRGMSAIASGPNGVLYVVAEGHA